MADLGNFELLTRVIFLLECKERERERERESERERVSQTQRSDTEQR